MTRFVALICILPLFAQSFYYLLPVAPLYYLSKVWPVLMLPAAAWALTRLQLQSRTIYVIWLAYAIGLTPFVTGDRPSVSSRIASRPSSGSPIQAIEALTMPSPVAASR